MKTSRIMIVALFGWCCLASGAVAQQHDATGQQSQIALPQMPAIEQAWARGDFLTVREGLQQLAEHTENPLAFYRYGRVLLEGRGGPVDVAGAVMWLEKAVAQNHLEASTLLARVYLSGMPAGPDRDVAKAFKLLSGAAARGNVEAQYYLGILYRSGEGVAQDLTAAFNWFLAAAEKNHVGAQYELARAYSRGEGTQKDDVQGWRWLTEAANAGHSEAQFFAGMAHDTGNGAAQNTQQAINWYRRAAEQGHIVAQRRLGEIYLNGRGVEPNVSEATRWLGQAAQAGDMRSVYILGRAYGGQSGVPANPKRAWEFFNQAAQGGYAPAFTAMAQMLEAGFAGAVDMVQVVTLYRKAAGAGDADAALRLGELAGAGQLAGLAPPHFVVPWAMAAARAGDTAALKWVAGQADQKLRPAQAAYGLWLHEQGRSTEGASYLQAAAQAGEVVAQHQLGMMLAKGDGIDTNYVQAHSWLNIAAAGGHAKAAEMRGVISDLMTPEQIAEAQKIARKFFDAAAQAPIEVRQ